ncbi:hypothetical protein BaRGS_00037383, partial [Batillaria attramentaria]
MAESSVEERFLEELEKIRQIGARQMMNELEYRAIISDLLAAQGNAATKSRHQYYLMTSERKGTSWDVKSGQVTKPTPQSRRHRWHSGSVTVLEHDGTCGEEGQSLCRPRKSFSRRVILPTSVCHRPTPGGDGGRQVLPVFGVDDTCSFVRLACLPR